MVVCEPETGKLEKDWAAWQGREYQFRCQQHAVALESPHHSYTATSPFWPDLAIRGIAKPLGSR